MADIVHIKGKINFRYRPKKSIAPLRRRGAKTSKKIGKKLLLIRVSFWTGENLNITLFGDVLFNGDVNFFLGPPPGTLKGQKVIFFENLRQTSRNGYFWDQ